MAKVRAVTMQPRMSARRRARGMPLAATNVARSAQGRAKIVWESLMSAAKAAH